MDLKKFAEDLNSGFGTPFLPPDFVRAHITEQGTLCFRIGHRDLEFDENLERISSGTATRVRERWLIKKPTELQ